MSGEMGQMGQAELSEGAEETVDYELRITTLRPAEGTMCHRIKAPLSRRSMKAFTSSEA